MRLDVLLVCPVWPIAHCHTPGDITPIACQTERSSSRRRCVTSMETKRVSLLPGDQDIGRDIKNFGQHRSCSLFVPPIPSDLVGCRARPVQPALPEKKGPGPPPV